MPIISVYIHCNSVQLYKNKVMQFAATWMKIKDVMLSEVSQKESESKAGVIVEW